MAEAIPYHLSRKIIEGARRDNAIFPDDLAPDKT